THPVMSGPAIQRLSEAPIKEIVVTNTIPTPADKKLPNMTVLSIAPLVGEAIVRIHEDLSVSKLFEA
ncbi:MAG TPA: ribose-phosphate pyrophosphokinase, partial [Syntrophomonas sp.]|nr:ribose-phosphate pyrophosphokinase [Syntrophomonas sp.]